MPEAKEESSSLPWGALVATLAALSGLLWAFPQLRSSRPVEDEGRSVDASGERDVDAQLCEDPFAAVARHDEYHEKHEHSGAKLEIENPAVESEDHYAHSFDALVEKAKAFTLGVETPSDVAEILIIGVMVESDPAAGRVESRIRARQSIVHGLYSCGYQPEDSNHINFFRARWLRNAGNPSDFSLVREQAKSPIPKVANIPIKSAQEEQLAHAVVQSAPQPKSEKKIAYDHLLVPYEFWKLDPARHGNHGAKRAPCALVLWLPEERIEDKPILRFSCLVKDIVNPEKATFTLLGPSTSGTLANMVEESFEHGWMSRDNKSKNQCLQPIMSRLRIVSAEATVPEEVLTKSKQSDSLTIINQAIQRIADDNKTHFYRTIADDSKVAQEICEELRRRHVIPGVHPILLISECDSVYGRAIPLAFENFGGKSWTMHGLSSGPWFRTRYLSHLDGVVPGNSKIKEHENNYKPTGEAASRSELETPDGPSQADYLRRLAQQIEDLDGQLKLGEFVDPNTESAEQQAASKNGIRAIGILGSDIYDKLMILRALRKHFPGVLFFTNDMDARLAHPAEWDATHNLLIGSSFGLQLERSQQDGRPPFRDCYQTSKYAAIRWIADAANFGENPSILANSPRIFEVGFRGFIDLSREDKEHVHPSSQSHFGWWTMERRLIALTILVCAVLFGMLAVWLIGHRIRAVYIFKNSQLFVTGCIAATIIIIQLLYAFQGPEGEPFHLFSGVSAWPTIGLRIFAILLCLHFYAKARIELIENDRKLKRRFCLADVTSADEEPSILGTQASNKAVRKRYFRFDPPWKLLGFGKWNILVPLSEQDAGKYMTRVDANRLWRCYLVRGWERYRFIRILPFVVLHVIAGFLLVQLLGRPHDPCRGDYCTQINSITIFISAATVTLLVFYVLDATFLNAAFIRHLSRGVTRWPDEAVKQERSQLGLPDGIISERLDIEMIGQRTEIVNKLVYYPFVILIILAVSRASSFDDWDWPLGIILTTGLYMVYSIYAAWKLRDAAEQARKVAIEKLRKQVILATIENKEALAKGITELISDIRATRTGAFASFLEQPVVGVVLLQSGGVGLLSLLQAILPK